MVVKTDNTRFVKGLKEAGAKINALLTKRMKVATEYLEAEAVKEAPADTGILRASMTSDVKLTSGQIIGMVGNTQLYALYVHQGTGIYAKDGNGRKDGWYIPIGTGKGQMSPEIASRYKFRIDEGKDGMKFAYTKGQKPNPFLEKAKDKNKDSIRKLLGRSFSD